MLNIDYQENPKLLCIFINIDSIIATKELPAILMNKSKKGQ